VAGVVWACASIPRVERAKQLHVQARMGPTSGGLGPAQLRGRARMRAARFRAVLSREPEGAVGRRSGGAYTYGL
jgi:hypothetical protein